MKGCLKIYLYTNNEKASKASIAHLGTIYEDPEVLLVNLIKDHGPGRVYMDAEGAFFNEAGVLLEEPGPDEDEEPEEDLPYAEENGVFTCLAEGCDKTLKSKKGILGHIAKEH